MSRTLGASDKVRRAIRSDRGKKRKRYAGKLIKSKTRKRYEKKIGTKSVLKLWIWEAVPMSYEGLKRWNKYTRAYARKIVFPPSKRLRIDVHVSEIDTKEKIERLVADNMWNGYFYVMGFSNAKNRYHTKPVQMCHVQVRDTEKGMIGIMVKDLRMFRYRWFYKS